MPPQASGAFKARSPSPWAGSRPSPADLGPGCCTVVGCRVLSAFTASAHSMPVSPRSRITRTGSGPAWRPTGRGPTVCSHHLAQLLIFPLLHGLLPLPARRTTSDNFSLQNRHITRVRALLGKKKKKKLTSIRKRNIQLEDCLVL